jgi:nucleoside 2-deoxyribosyltransferase
MDNLEKELKKIFIICPVRNMTSEEKDYLENYLSSLEAKGIKVHYPPRDTNQNDQIGFNICMENRKAILESDEIHIFYNPESTGTHFDLEMAFAFKKPIRLINKIEGTENKSFKNVLRYLNSLDSY